ncbi:MAG: CvpA family protein [Proteobacteria bacterium]|nr:CvpA family protein [Pseudomonadota bacterium]
MEFFSLLTIFDTVILFIIGFSLIRGIMRGFTTELLKLISWFGALLITLYGIAFGASDFARRFIQPDSLADIVALGVLFFTSFILLRYLAGKIGERVKDSPIGILDRSLGALFGLVRGLVVVAAGYLLLDFFLTDKTMDDWAEDAQTRPLVSYSAQMLATIVPDIVKKAKDFEAENSILEGIKKNAPTPSELATKGQGYTEEMRNKLENILEEKEKKEEDGND